MIDALTLLKRFLRCKGWGITAQFESLVIWTCPELDDRGQPIKISLPASSEFTDTDALCDKAINLLSLVYKQSKSSLQQSIEGLGYDLFRQRVNLESNEDSIPLEMASILIKNLEKLVSYAACLEDDIQPFFHKNKKIGKKTVDKCRFAHTFSGSFGIQLQMPVPPSIGPASESKVPFERRVMQRLGQGFYDVTQAVRNADASLLVTSYKSGFNANMYEALQELLNNSPNGKSEFSFLWSSEYPVHQTLAKNSTIRLLSDDVTPLIETAAKELRKCSESENILITGQIIQLHSDDDLPEYDDEPDFIDEGSRRLMVVNWESEPGRKTKIRVSLSETDHKLACDAYKYSCSISVRGRPEKRGKFFHLSAPKDFQLDTNDPLSIS
jgi:hypothetical protein